MTRTFVAIDDPVHRLIRNTTRRTPLALNEATAIGPWISYRVKEQELPEEYFTLVMLHSVGGMPLPWVTRGMWRARDEDRREIAEQVDFFDLLKLDRRCCRDLRLKPAAKGAPMLSAELLACGTGTLRARNDDAGDPLHQFMSSQYGRITSAREVVYARIRTLHRRAGGSPQPTVAKESYDSTNLIYGDVLGELEQLWDRRADTHFLDNVAKSLSALRCQGQATIAVNAPFNVPEMVRLHLRAQSLWNRPPGDARALLRRIEFILDRLYIDHANSGRSQAGQCRLEAGPNAARTGTSGARALSAAETEWAEPSGRLWCDDASGYDGWLSGNGSGSTE
jgi:hypothetical protein